MLALKFTKLDNLPQDVAAPLYDAYHSRRDEITGA
jgi:hypothetical protein